MARQVTAANPRQTKSLFQPSDPPKLPTPGTAQNAPDQKPAWPAPAEPYQQMKFPPLPEQPRTRVYAARTADYTDIPVDPYAKPKEHVPTAEELERAAIEAPTSIRQPQSTALMSAPATPSQDYVDKLARLMKDINGGSKPEVTQVAQNRNDFRAAFLESAKRTTEKNYLPNTRTSALSPYELKVGTFIPAVLKQNANSDMPGELNAMVTSDVSDSATWKHVLIKQGSTLHGRYSSDVAYGQSRIQVVWDQLIFPDGSMLDLDGMTGADAQGNSGMTGKVDRHYKRLFAFAGLTSMLTATFGLSQRSGYGAYGGYGGPSTRDILAAEAGREISQTGAQITRENMHIKPTIKIPAGTKIAVQVNRNIVFYGPYEPDVQSSPERPTFQKASQ